MKWRSCSRRLPSKKLLIHSLFLLDQMCPKMNSKMPFSSNKPTEEKGIEKHNYLSLDHDLGPGKPFMSSSWGVLRCCSRENLNVSFCLRDILLGIHSAL